MLLGHFPLSQAHIYHRRLRSPQPGLNRPSYARLVVAFGRKPGKGGKGEDPPPLSEACEKDEILPPEEAGPLSSMGEASNTQQQVRYVKSESPISSEVAPLSTQNEVIPYEGDVEGFGGSGPPPGPAPAANMQRHRANISGPALPEHISFISPVAGPDTPPSDVLLCPDIREHLEPQDSPFLRHKNWDSGFVDDEDRVAINTLDLATPSSSGAGDMCVNASVRSAADNIVAPSYTVAAAAAAAGSSPMAEIQRAHPGNSFAPIIEEMMVEQQEPIPDVPCVEEEDEVSSKEAAKAVGLDNLTTRPFHVRKDIEGSRRLCVPLPPWAMRAGPRSTIYHDPKTVTAAIVTCGGLCPGTNDVVQGIVHRLTDYGVPEEQILGIRHGFRGFYEHTLKPHVLTRQEVEGAHLHGGTMLGTSRGGADIDAIVKRLQVWGVSMLFVIGGDGGNKGAQAISEKCQDRGVRCCVVGVPKSIDNDILLMDHTFGFQTAVDEAQRSLLAAKVEATSGLRGIGLVKLMGRQSGFIAMQASLASGLADICLIPEEPFDLEGEHGLLAYIEQVMAYKGHCVVCCAEGAGQSLLQRQDGSELDPSGNVKLKDIGMFLKHKIRQHFATSPTAGGPVDLKLIDPTYMIRTIKPGQQDSIYCKVLAHSAVDAAFAGYTGICVAQVNTHFAMLPIPVITKYPRRVDPLGKPWTRLKAAVRQPPLHK